MLQVVLRLGSRHLVEGWGLLGWVRRLEVRRLRLRSRRDLWEVVKIRESCVHSSWDDIEPLCHLFSEFSKSLVTT